MSLVISIDEPRPQTKRLLLNGSLDTHTTPQLDEALDQLLDSDEVNSVILDLSQLQYISSAGLRVIFKLRKMMRDRNGTTYAINPQPQVKKVFDIVKAMPVESLFTSVEELDRYLDTMQRKFLENQ
ncbi:MAG: STAS domain-containing protein [Prochlorotrichaceae cyanobacterium]|jgi:anti-anti-sigma factor